MIDYIQIFGERCSGTGWMKSLISNNADVSVGSKMSKHWIIDYEKLASMDNTLFISVFKDPYSWIASMKRFPHHFINKEQVMHDMSMGEFISMPIVSIDKGKTLDPIFKNISECRNVKNENLLGLEGKIKNYAVLRYEDLLQNPAYQIQKLLSYFSIPFKGKFTSDLRQWRGNVHLENTFLRKNYYLNKEYLQEFTRENLDYINATLDESLEYKLGYELER